MPSIPPFLAQCSLLLPLPKIWLNLLLFKLYFKRTIITQWNFLWGQQHVETVCFNRKFMFVNHFEKFTYKGSMSSSDVLFILIEQKSLIQHFLAKLKASKRLWFVVDKEANNCGLRVRWKCLRGRISEEIGLGRKGYAIWRKKKP